MKITLGILVLCLSAPALAAQVQGYYRRDGTYVAPHSRTNPDGNPYNNYSTQGNYNPNTGQMGTVNPYSSPQIVPTPSYLPPPPPMYTPPYGSPYRP
jgi:hypothetical protein